MALKKKIKRIKEPAAIAIAKLKFQEKKLNVRVIEMRLFIM